MKTCNFTWDLGLKLQKIHHVLELNQLQWSKSYIEFNTRKKIEAEKGKDKDEKALYKLMNNATIGFIIFRDFSMYYQILLSPQVKRLAIITYKYSISELPHKLPNDLRLRMLGN